MDDDNKVLGIYFDLQKAFDTVDHQILLSKLCHVNHVGLRGVMYNWIQNYLINRKQFSIVNCIPSSMGDIFVKSSSG